MNYKDKNILYEKYFIEKRSIQETAIYFGCSDHNIRYWIKKHNIPKNNIHGNNGKIRTEKTRRKISVATKGENNPFFGKKHSIKTKEKIKNYWKNEYKKELHPNYGKKLSKETCEKKSKSMKKKNLCGENNPFFGKKHSGQTKKILSKKLSGKNNPMWGKKVSKHVKEKIRNYWTEEKRQEFSESRKGSKHPLFGKTPSDETKSKMSKSKKELLTKNGGSYGAFGKSKSEHWNWRGGLTSVYKTIRNSSRYKDWRTQVFTRDNFVCVFCKGKNMMLNADHVIPFSQIVKENKILSLEDAYRCEKLWDITNGRTLCIECHKNTDTYGSGHVNKKEHAVKQISKSA